MTKKLLIYLGLKGCFLISCLFFLTIFLFQNSELITVKFLVWELLEFPMFYLVTITFVLGIILGVAFSFYFFSKNDKNKYYNSSTKPIDSKEMNYD